MLPPKVFTNPFRYYIHSILAVANLLAHNNKSNLLLRSNFITECFSLRTRHHGGNIYFAANGRIKKIIVTNFKTINPVRTLNY